MGHLDLTIAVRMDWHEGFQVYGEYGSVLGKTFNPWYLRSSEVECFSVRDGQYHRVLGEDGHTYDAVDIWRWHPENASAWAWSALLHTMEAAFKRLILLAL